MCITLKFKRMRKYWLFTRIRKRIGKSAIFTVDVGVIFYLNCISTYIIFNKQLSLHSYLKYGPKF